MYSNRHSLAHLGLLGAVFFATIPASAQCTEQWLPGEGLPGLNGDVSAVAVYDDGNGAALYVGGDFTVAGHVVANNIAKWDGTQWQPLGSGMNDEVRTLAVYNGELIAGGEFNTAGGKEANNIARWDGANWSPLGSGVSSHVNALTVYNDELIAGGWFTIAGGIETVRVARWDGTGWSSLGTGMNNRVYTLTEYNGELIVGGDFYIASGTAANHIARWNGKFWSALGSGMGTGLLALTAYNGELIAGGTFTTAGETLANRIARWDGTTWSPLGSGMEGGQYHTDVHALTVYNGELIAGGTFTIAGGTPANYIARWDGSTWSPLGSGMGADDWPYRPDVYALTVYNGELIAAGWFTNAGGIEVDRIARWDGASWSPLGQGITGSVHKDPPSVHALASYNGELIVGGNFLNAGGTTTNNIAQWDGANWSPLGSGMGGEDGNHETPVFALTAYKGELIAGGDFTNAGGMHTSRIASWNGKSWSPLGGGMQGGYYGQVLALAVFSGELIAGGYFTFAGGTEVNFIARWVPGGWSSLGSGMNSSVRALTDYNSELIAGGDFVTAGEHVSAYWARWGSDAPLGDLDGDCTISTSDLLILFSNWGQCPPPEKSECPADLDGNGAVNTSDLLILFANWG